MTTTIPSQVQQGQQSIGGGGALYPNIGVSSGNVNNNNNNNALYKDIRLSIQAWVTPSVLVITSPSVTKTFQKLSAHSGNLFTDILQQYITGHRKVPVRVGESYYELNDFKVNFITLQHLEPASYTQTLLDTSSSIDSIATDEYCQNFKIRTKQDVPYFHKVCPEPTPWYEKYRHHYMRACHNPEIETFSHPLAVLVVASSEDSNPIGLLVKMFDAAKPPAILQQFNADSNVPKLYVLVHPENSATESEKRLSEMKSTFGPDNSYLMRISTKEDDGGLTYDPSTAASSPVHSIVTDLFQKHLPQFIGKSIQELSETIVANKKSFFSKMKVSLRIGYKKNEKEGEDASSSVSMELCLRRLSDLYFLLQDYENALANYKTLLKEYSSEKSPNYYAATYEMIGMCNFMLNKDTDTQFETSINNYLRAGLNAASVRAAMIQGEVLKRKSHFKLLADLFKSIAEREIDPFCAAVLLEQAGFCLLQSPAPSFRKACMRLVLAGDRYAEASKRKHALRCYSFAYGAYEGRDWNFIEDHLHLALVRYSFFQGHTSDSILFVNKLLEKNCQSFQSQNSIIREFLFISKSTTKDNYIGELPIPIVHNERTTVFLSDYSSELNQQVWQEMEEAFKKEAAIITKPVLQGFDLWRRDQFFEQEKERTIVVEEAITVEAEIKNPLQVPLQFNRAHLVAIFKDGENGQEESNMSPLDDETLAKMDQGVTPFKVEHFDVLLGPSETKKLTLSIVPLRQGQLVIKGIGLCMCGSVWGKREFKLKQKRLNKTKAQRETVSYEPNLSLTFKVTSPMPRLESQFIEFPSSICHGEMKQAKLQLKNCSTKMGLKNVRIRLSHPTLVCFGSNNDDASILNSLDSSIPLNIELPPGATVTVPLWVRGLVVGRYTLRCLVYYESEAGNSELKYRLARCQTDFDVKPSLRISTFCQQSSTNINSYLMGIEIDNPIIGGGGDIFYLKQISSLSKQWKIVPLSYHDDVPNGSILTLHPGQFTNLFFGILPSSVDDRQATATATTTAMVAPGKQPQQQQQQQQHQQLTITNISFDKNEPMYDSSSFPVFQFLEYEKMSHESAQSNAAKLGQSASISANPRDSLKSPISSDFLVGEHQNLLDMMLFWESTPQATKSQMLLKQVSNRMGVLNATAISFLPTHHNDSLLATPWGSWRNTTSPTGKIQSYVDPSLRFQAPLRYQLQSPLAITHKFDHEAICTVPLQLQLSNCSAYHHLQLSIETILPHENLDAVSQLTSQYFWTGITRYNIQLAPLKSVELPLHVCFLRAGTYNVNRFKINVKLDNSGEFSKDIFPNVQHLINVEDAAANS
ncbi:hypothetical protein SAMD00019534_061440 [Acytostelium subglobosum LB1]|uniref:hypothetical protein n=1 Tax=Acytostelium subglobosum LB1 TaxID=1410327 RepID=UPI000644F7B3|nr:hypothetical protein SAMD00019534_061440 [Acytostelium subglobosum LB1]GAM22969.1 hypothetical protein SAMD00019534_061440 [Acytostelium subglobosum LB1]|eukprot:XP_012754196.1 hypothetical protein SAMD00019534_061440 [Acytostelium subglobosum LB1]